MNTKKLETFLTKNPMLVDIRTPVQYRNSHIEKSVNLPLRNFCNKLPTLDKKQHIVLICDKITDSDVSSCLNYANLFKIEKIIPVEFENLNKLLKIEAA